MGAKIGANVHLATDNCLAYDVLEIGDDSSIAALESQPPSDATTFDEWRGGVGLSLINARRILSAHGGTIAGPAEGGKSAARIVLPSA